MQVRFQRRIRVMPGVALNLSKRGVGVSLGGRGLHVGVDARGRRYTSASLPGTGLSVRQYAKPTLRRECDHCAPGHVHLAVLDVAVALVILAVICYALLR